MDSREWAETNLNTLNSINYILRCCNQLIANKKSKDGIVNSINEKWIMIENIRVKSNR